MSTTWDDDETNATLSHLATLFARLDAAHERVLGGTNSGNQHVQRLLGECKEHLDLWEKEYIGTDGRKFRSIAARNEEQASRIRRKVDEANALMQHCEFKLRMPQRSFQGLRITEYVVARVFPHLIVFGNYLLTLNKGTIAATTATLRFREPYWIYNTQVRLLTLSRPPSSSHPNLRTTRVHLLLHLPPA
jgi:hypothetical protein